MDLAVWRSAFASAAAEFLSRVVAYLPTLVAALGLFVLGYVVALAAHLIVSRLLTGSLALLMRYALVGRAVARTRFGPGLVAAASRVVFWFIVALFAAAAVERLELTVAASLVSAFAAFLPRVFVALVIVFGSVVAGHLARATTTRAASVAGLAQAELLARAVQVVVVFFGLVTAADQLGIHSTLLTVVVATAVGAILGGATLAFGLGSRVAVSNIVAIFYLLKTYRIGHTVRIGDIQGQIVDITQTGVFIATPAGRVLVPGRCFSEQTSTLVTGDPS